MKIQLYRGITVPEDECENVINDIKSNGLNIHKDSFWKPFIIKNLKPKLEEFFSNPSLTRKETEPESILINTQTGGYRDYTEGVNCICFADIRC